MFPFPLKPHIHYTHAGEYFSKLLFLDASVKEGSSLVHIVEGTDIQKKYTHVAKELGISYTLIESYHDILSIATSTGGIFSIVAASCDTLLCTQLLQSKLHISVGDQIFLEDMMRQLQDLSYEFHEYEKAGSYTRKGDIMRVILPDDRVCVINFWGNEIESIILEGVNIHTFDFYSLAKLATGKKPTLPLKELFKTQKVWCILDMLEFHPLFEAFSGEAYRSSSFGILGSSAESSEDLHIQGLVCSSLEEFVSYFRSSKNTIRIYTRYGPMMEKFVRDNSLHASLKEVKTPMLTSFSYENPHGEKHIFLADDVISKIFIKRRLRKKLSADIDLLLKIQEGDYIVHIDHGIGVYKGIVKKQLGEIEKEYLEIAYKQEDKLFVPITEVHRVSKYIGKEHPELTPLSGKVWERKMQKIHEDIREIAEELLKNFAERKLRSGSKNILDTKKIEHFQSLFPYSYTQDQEQSIEEILSDMQSDKNMDRLLVGDVGFGKTEVAFNAAYVALLNKKQVVLISPLVVLAHEHYAKAVERFAGLGIRIEVLTRLQSQAHASRVIKGLADGSIDMVIGTHRLLSEKLSWKKLGLLIVDEEHKFGVVDKEKIKNIKADIDILSLSATPIPRSLNLALSGVRDISLLKTPPLGRKSIQTLVSSYNEAIIQAAGEKEFARGGQIFFVHNRVSNIAVFQKQLESLFPSKKVIVTHGQLPGDELEDRILAFKQKKYDILLSTTVIENGIDFSNVNTIFINECQSFGISQIHQLRGRVGRSDAQGYCYLLYKKDTLESEAAKRIQTIVDYSYLGAGFELAMKDLEIRGGGDILGVKQSGQAQEIGISLFLKMLEEKIEDLKQHPDQPRNLVFSLKKSCTIELSVSAGIPDSYFLSESDKLHFYREIEQIEDVEDLEYLKKSFFENGVSQESIPESTQLLFCLLECQLLAQKYNIRSIKRVGVSYQIDFGSSDLETLKAFLARDTQVRFQVVDISKLRSPTKLFVNDKNFLEYLLALLQGSNFPNKKIKLVSKKL